MEPANWSIYYIDYNTYNAEYSTMELSHSILIFAHWLCLILGFVAFCINMFVMLAILLNRQTMLKNTFYTLVMHCTLVDIFRSAALIGWCLPGLQLVAVLSFVEVKKCIMIVLKNLNVLTALNLLVFTVNEFVLVRRPLHYKQVFRRRMVCSLIGASWSVSLTLVIGGFFIRNLAFGRHDDREIDDHEKTMRNIDKAWPETDELFLLSEMLKENDRNSSTNSTYDDFPHRKFNNILVQNVFNSLITSICLACLIIVVICYAMILHRIKQFHCQAKIRTDFHNRLRVYVNQNTPNQARISGSAARFSRITLEKDSSCTERRKPLPSFYRWKYVVVVGFVIIVNVLFLLPYSFIQIFQYLHLSRPNRGEPINASEVVLRWVLQILIGVHSVLQPICYFRVKNFCGLLCKNETHRRILGNKQTTFEFRKSCNRSLIINNKSNDERGDGGSLGSSSFNRRKINKLATKLTMEHQTML